MKLSLVPPVDTRPESALLASALITFQVYKKHENAVVHVNAVGIAILSSTLISQYLVTSISQ